jgi:hypothetical protein
VVLITLIDALKCLLRSHIIEAEKVKKIGKGRRGFLNNRRISPGFWKLQEKLLSREDVSHGKIIHARFYDSISENKYNNK